MPKPAFKAIWTILAVCVCAATLAACSAHRGRLAGDPWHRSEIPAHGAPSVLTDESALSDAIFVDPSAPPSPPPISPDPVMGSASVVAGPPVKVGLLSPSSGKNAALGQALLKSAQLAVFDLGYPGFELVPRDTGDSPEGAARAAREALNAGARILIGPLTAPAARAVQPIARAANVPMLTFSTDWTLAGANTYVMGFMPFSQVRRIAAWAARNGMRSLAVVAPENDYGSAVVSALSAQAPALGLRLAGVARVPAGGGPGMTPVIGELVARSATAPFDAVLIAAGGSRAQEISNALTTAGLGPERIMRLGTGLWDDPMTAANGALEGAAFAAPAPRARSAFEQKYAGLYGINPPRLATLAYDATALAAILARTAPAGSGADPFSRPALMNPNGFAGMDGIFRFRPDGLIERGDAVLMFRNRAIVEADPAPESFQLEGY